MKDKESRKLIAVSPEAYEHLKKASENTSRSLISLADAVITREIDWLNNPTKINEYFSMVKDEKNGQ